MVFSKSYGYSITEKKRKLFFENDLMRYDRISRRNLVLVTVQFYFLFFLLHISTFQIFYWNTWHYALLYKLTRTAKY